MPPASLPPHLGVGVHDGRHRVVVDVPRLARHDLHRRDAVLLRLVGQHGAFVCGWGGSFGGGGRRRIHGSEGRQPYDPAAGAGNQAAASPRMTEVVHPSRPTPTPHTPPPAPLLTRDDVADGINGGHLGPEVVVHLDAAALVRGQPHVLEAQPLGEGAAAWGQGAGQQHRGRGRGGLAAGRVAGAAGGRPALSRPWRPLCLTPHLPGLLLPFSPPHPR
jgi:hypothetical protein